MTGTHVRSTIALVSVIAALVAFQNCGRGFQGTGGLARTLSSTPTTGTSVLQTATLSDRFAFSKDFQKPASKQGIMEYRRIMSGGEQDQRYATLRNAGARYRHYNMYWQELEKTSVVSSSSPVTCPAGSTMYPANEADRVNLGFHKFRCLDDFMIGSYDINMRRDQDNGMQSAVVLYTTPPAYRNAGCEGFVIGANREYIGCVPRADAMDDFEDFANVLAQRYNGGANGKITHWIVWNENASTEWFDLTPIVGKNATDPGSVNARIDKYVDMMKRVHAALSRHVRGALMYVSTDQLWAPNLVAGHMGTQTLLDGIWARLGIDYSWSVSVHPYQDVDRPAPQGMYTWNNIEMVVNYQNQKLGERGVADPANYPQGMLIAGEQGWLSSGGIDYQARQVCLAHDRAMQNPQIIAVANNTFQDVPSGDSNGGESLSLIPTTIPNSLAGMENTATGRAYLSTLNPALWGQRADHYCCQVVGVGCGTQTAPNHDVRGTVDGVNGNVLNGWACATGVETSIDVHVYANGPAGTGTIAVAATANQASEAAVAQACGVGAGAFRFAIPLTDDLRTRFAGQTLFVHGISPVGGDNKLIDGSGQFRMPAAPVAQVVVVPPTGTDTTAADAAAAAATAQANAAAQAAAQAQADAAAAQSATYVYQTSPIYRFFQRTTGEHFFTSSAGEGLYAGYGYEGVGFNVVTTAGLPGTHGVYRCFIAGKHFVSTDANCEGQTVEGQYGALYDDDGAGRVALYRLYQPSTGDHLISTSMVEGLGVGYSLEGRIGFAPR